MPRILLAISSRLRGRLGELHAARLAAAAGVHLRLHDDRAAELLRDRLDLRRASWRPRRAESARPRRAGCPSPDTRGCSRRLRCDGRSCLAAHRVPAAISAVMIARPPVRRTKSIAARTFGAMLPSPNAPARSIASASSTVSSRSGRCCGVPQSAYTASTSVRISSSSRAEIARQHRGREILVDRRRRSLPSPSPDRRRSARRRRRRR